MNSVVFWRRLLNQVLFLFSKNIVTVCIKDGNEWKPEQVDGPVAFSDLDERFGSGNWSL